MTSLINALIALVVGAWAMFEFIEGNYEKSQTLLLFAIFVELCEGFSSLRRKEESK